MKAFFVYNIKDILKMPSGNQKERTPSLILTIELNLMSSFPTNGWSTARSLQTQGSNQLRYGFSHRVLWKHEATVT